jgi:hypothetical protein
MAKLDYEPAAPRPSLRDWVARHGRTLALLVVVAAAILLLGERLSPAGVQRRATREALAFQQSKTAVLTADSRFAGIQMSVSSNRTLQVRGNVPSDEALVDLRNLVQRPAGGAFQIAFWVEVLKTRRATGERHARDKALRH